MSDESNLLLVSIFLLCKLYSLQDFVKMKHICSQLAVKCNIPRGLGVPFSIHLFNKRDDVMTGFPSLACRSFVTGVKDNEKKCESDEKQTSEANESRFISPPDIPRILPGTPIIVSLHFVKPS